MWKYCKNWNGIYLHFKGNGLPIFMKFSLSVEQNHTEKLRNTLYLLLFLKYLLLFLKYPLLPDCLCKCLHQGKREGTTVFWRKFFPRQTAWCFHYNSSLRVINNIFKHILKSFSSWWILVRSDIKHKFTKGDCRNSSPFH